MYCVDGIMCYALTVHLQFLGCLDWGLQYLTTLPFPVMVADNVNYRFSAKEEPNADVEVYIVTLECCTTALIEEIERS